MSCSPLRFVVLLLAMTGSATAQDFLQADNWRMTEAQQELATAIGSAMVHDITIGADRVHITAEHPNDPQQTTDYTWDGETVRTGISFPNFTAMGMGDTKPFPLSELPFVMLPQVKSNARHAFENEDAEIVEIEASQPTNRASKKVLPLWEVTLRELNGETGTVWLTGGGQVVEVSLPKSRQAVFGPWLAPETVEMTLYRLEEEFGPQARFVEILIDDSKASIKLEDPQSPGNIAEFLMDEQGIKRWGISGMVDPFAPSLERAFTVSDIKALDAVMLGDLAQRTLSRMGREDMTVFRYTISRAILFMTPQDDRLLVEVRAGAPDGWTSGRVTYDMDGAEVDVVLP